VCGCGVGGEYGVWGEMMHRGLLWSGKWDSKVDFLGKFGTLW
jgi:hypothetical protein